MNMVDYGTEYGVEVGLSGTTHVQVFNGALTTEFTNGEAHRLSRGDAIEIGTGDSKFRDVAFDHDRFIRTFPKRLDTASPGGPLYGASRLTALRVLPAPVECESTEIFPTGIGAERFERPATAPTTTRTTSMGPMMYDAERLYISAHIGDPYPMRNAGQGDFRGAA